MAQAGRPSKGMTLSKHNIELAIKSTQSMGQAALYMGVAKILSRICETARIVETHHKLQRYSQNR